MQQRQITILGVGNILFSDEGFGVRVIEELQRRYQFSDNVHIVDGGVLGLNLLGIITECDYLIVVDAIRNQGKGGSLYRLDGDKIPQRIRAKNSLHQIDLLETLTLCQALDNVPETVILGVEPQDMETLGLDLTPVVKGKIDSVIGMVLKELDNLGVTYSSRSQAPVGAALI